MVLKVLSSGSKGNCYVLTDSNGKRLILDAGIQYKKILDGIGYELLSVNGVCVTHEHKDHSLSANEFKIRGIPIYRPYAYVPNARLKAYFGNFHIQCFSLEHDVPCYGFLITHPEMGKLVYITDTAYCKYRFKDLNHILVECNYDERMLDEEYEAKGHVLHDHFELGAVKRFIAANETENLRTIVLCHPSETNLDKMTALTEVRNACRYKEDVSIATTGLEITL